MEKLDDIKPYSDNDNIRTFSYDVDDAELIWHRDKNSRTVEVLSTHQHINQHQAISQQKQNHQNIH